MRRETARSAHKTCSGLTCLFLVLAPSSAQAVGEPDPVNAVLLSTGSTLVPLGMATGLLTTGRKAQEGVRFDTALVLTNIGTVIGPAVGQWYARGGTNAWVTLGLRTVTSATMSVGMALRLRGADEDQGLGNALFWVGLVPTALLALYDIIGAYSTARESKYRGAPIAKGTGLTPDLVNVAICGPVPCAVPTSR